MNGKKYINIVNECIQTAYSTQEDTILAVAHLMAKTIEAKKNVFVFGCSHAGILAEEVFYRTGGLAVINPIFFYVRLILQVLFVLLFCFFNTILQRTFC